MIYTLLLHYPEMSAEGLGEEAMRAGMAAFDAYARALEEAGALVSAEVLQPSTASTTVRRRDGEPVVQDGPFAATREQLGGVFVLDLPDLDAALDWAGRAPSTEWGAVEVRPVAVRFVERLRGEVRFDAVDALVAQMQLDVDQTRALLTSA